MRIAAVGDIHGQENLEAFRADLERLGPVDLFLLAGDTTERNDHGAFDVVLTALRARVEAPVWAVFGNNEYAHDHPAYLRTAEAHGVRVLQDESATFSSAQICTFEDADNAGNAAFQGTVAVSQTTTTGPGY